MTHCMCAGCTGFIENSTPGRGAPLAPTHHASVRTQELVALDALLVRIQLYLWCTKSIIQYRKVMHGLTCIFCQRRPMKTTINQPFTQLWHTVSCQWVQGKLQRNPCETPANERTPPQRTEGPGPVVVRWSEVLLYIRNVQSVGRGYPNMFAVSRRNPCIIMYGLFAGLEEEGTKHFEVSPDGKFIAFMGKYGRIHLVSATVCHTFLCNFYACLICIELSDSTLNSDLFLVISIKKFI